jgi:16S rRNA (adenine1518-N6/adenine1519-N6)-dimethyltransferase
MRKKGQHFLVDRRIIERIADYANLNSRDRVLEIGPGTGNLTEILSARAFHVTAVEVDRTLASGLLDRFPNVDVICGDALRIDLPEYNKVVSNLPYQISSKITFRLLGSPFELAVLMYQKEFAERMVAHVGTKDYGRLTLSVWYYSSPEILEYVPKSAFRPRPRVESAIVKLLPKIKRPPVDETLFLDLLRGLFGTRRKTVGRSLGNMGVPRETVARLDESVLQKRPERLAPEEMVMLAEQISSLQIKLQ